MNYKKGTFIIINDLKKNINFNNKLAIVIDNKIEDNYIKIKTYNYLAIPNNYENFKINKNKVKKYIDDKISYFNWNDNPVKVNNKVSKYIKLS
jgi:hypothetical protein|tara:strand:+ start:357 stop:635 length:279 start_codon:yes stop_codon:yes gene_type:complete